MKIAALFEDSIGSGGGYNQALTAVEQMKKLCDQRGFDFTIYCLRPESIPFLERIGAPVLPITAGLSDKLLMLAAGRPDAMRLWRRFFKTGAIERKLTEDGCDLIYFLTPSARPYVLQSLNYIYTLWDNCHRDFPEFPEVRQASEFERRQAEIVALLPKAQCVLVDSETLKTRIARRYGLDEERLLAMPFSPAAFLAAPLAATAVDGTLAGLGLSRGYLFYPAQFWPHKNHARLVEAFGLLRAKGIQPRLVLSGGDKGNAAHIRALAERFDVTGQIHFAGFVASDDMRALYEGAAAVVMPTYFGPTNLPPLEAWATGCPLVYPRHLSGQTGDAAELFDVDSAEELAQAIERVLNPRVAAELVQKGTKRLEEIGLERAKAEAELGQRLVAFSKRRACWPN